MDAVYILGSGSLAKNEELRYSVRSLARYMRDLENIYIVGDKVDFLPGAIHIPALDLYPEPWKNAYIKTIRACSDERISQEFLLMNDDFFCNAPFEASNLPYYAREGGDVGKSGTHAFTRHFPMRIHASMYRKMPDMLVNDFGEFPRSFYCNYYQFPPSFVPDKVLRNGDRMPSFEDQLGMFPFFSIDDNIMLDPDFVLWLNSKYPEPSRFEMPI